MSHPIRRTFAVALTALGFAAALAWPTAQAPSPLKTMARESLAKISGEIAVPGLTGNIEVIRDTWGVPHIYAQNMDDLFFAQGYVMAQDRLWQMEMWRREREGRMAEILGPQAVERDRVARMLRYRGPMDDTEWTSYHPQGKRIFTAYAAGVNAWTPGREPGGTSTIGVYGLNGERQTLLTLPDSAAGRRNPVWSPDGRSLLLDEFEIPLDGSPPRSLPWIRDGVGWALSPDGSRVAYTSGKSLFVAAADGSAGVEVLGDGATRDMPALVNVLWSPTGDRIAFTSGNGTELRVIDVATGMVSLLIEPDGSDMLSVMAGGGFEFSPDGDRILFSRTEDEGAGASSLWSVNVDGSNLRRLVAGTAWGDWLSPTQAG